MTAVLVEQQQWVDSDGSPLNLGQAFFGVVDADPEASPITIYGDRELTTSISNPQTLDANGRTAAKVWLGVKYSIRIKNSAGVQKYLELDNGESTADIDTINFASISGSNTITGTSSLGLSVYTDGQIFMFKVASVNTGAVTFNGDSVGAKAIVKYLDKAVLSGEFEANQTISIAYNSTNDNFVWLNPNDRRLDSYKGSDVVAATATDIWSADGNTVTITGATAIVTFASAPNIGARQKIVFASTPTLTHGAAAIVLPGGVNYTAAAGDILDVYAETLTLHRVEITRASGQAVISLHGLRFIESLTASSSATLDFTGFDSTLYSGYLFTFGNVIPATDGTDLLARTSTDGGSSYDSGAGNYRYAQSRVDSAATIDTRVSVSATSINIAGEIGSDTDESGVSGDLTLISPEKSVRTQINWQFTIDTSSGTTRMTVGAGARLANADVDAIRFLMLAGNIESGTITMYGYSLT